MAKEKKIQRRECPMAVEEFREKARPLALKLGDVSIPMGTKVFSTGSFGWYASQKVAVTVGGVELIVQGNINFTVVGSKPEPTGTGK